MPKRIKTKYWDKREEAYLKDENQFLNELTRIYQRAYKELEEELVMLYVEISNDIVHQGSVNERQVLVSDLYKFNKWYETQNHIGSILQRLGQGLENRFQADLSDMYQKNYQEQGITSTSQLLDQRLVDEAIRRCWVGNESWSTRIWSDVNQLGDRLRQGMIDCFTKGSDLRELRDSLQDLVKQDVQQGLNRAMTLARTELSYVRNQATVDRYAAMGVKRYRVLVERDDKLCSICNGLKDTYDINRADVGVNLPPMHPNCRCTIIPVMEDIKI